MNDGHCTNWWSSTDFKWFENSYIKIEKSEQGVCLYGNKQGLRSLSKQIRQIVRKSIPVVTYDEIPGDLEEGSWSMTLKLISSNNDLTASCPKISFKCGNELVNFEWCDICFFAIIKEGNSGIQLTGNKWGLESFSDHLEIITQGAISNLSYEQSNDGYNNKLTLFGVQMINCQGR